MSEIRIPTQKRSVEKRNRIIDAGFNLICEKGYYNVTTNDIAKSANVSVGIIYQYFNDKKDIFMCGVKNYANNIMFPLLNILDNENFTIDDLPTLLNNLIDQFIKTHTMSKKAHEELQAMSHLDEDIAEIFNTSEVETTNKVVKILKNNNINITNINEKVHIAINLIDNLCHEIVYHQHKIINYDEMKKEVINIITSMLNN